ncbi:hypothetical protein HDV02_000471 [Globomyces sp. JEL0801]|nr:hypothetical protein HDV02_000471 [Globomyces sp. JEL0801]
MSVTTLSPSPIASVVRPEPMPSKTVNQKPMMTSIVQTTVVPDSANPNGPLITITVVVPFTSMVTSTDANFDSSSSNTVGPAFSTLGIIAISIMGFIVTLFCCCCLWRFTSLPSIRAIPLEHASRSILPKEGEILPTIVHVPMSDIEGIYNNVIEQEEKNHNLKSADYGTEVTYDYNPNEPIYDENGRGWYLNNYDYSHTLDVDYSTVVGNPYVQPVPIQSPQTSQDGTTISHSSEIIQEFQEYNNQPNQYYSHSNQPQQFHPVTFSRHISPHPVQSINGMDRTNRIMMNQNHRGRNWYSYAPQ